MGITNSNKQINMTQMDCSGVLKVTLALAAAPDISMKIMPSHFRNLKFLSSAALLSIQSPALSLLTFPWRAARILSNWIWEMCTWNPKAALSNLISL